MDFPKYIRDCIWEQAGDITKPFMSTAEKFIIYKMVSMD